MRQVGGRLRSQCPYRLLWRMQFFSMNFCVFVSLLRDFSLKQVFRNPSDLEFAS